MFNITFFVFNELDYVLPFRTYMAKATSNGAKPKYIIIGGTSENIGNNTSHEYGDPGEGELVVKKMTAYSVNRDIVIESNYADDIVIYSTAGQVVRAVKVYEGSNLYTGFAPGI